jgi:hypothetical protein
MVKCKAVLLNLGNSSDERLDPKRPTGDGKNSGGKKRPVRAAPRAKAIAPSEQWTKLLAKLIPIFRLYILIFPHAEPSTMLLSIEMKKVSR